MKNVIFSISMMFYFGFLCFNIAINANAMPTIIVPKQNTINQSKHKKPQLQINGKVFNTIISVKRIIIAKGVKNRVVVNPTTHFKIGEKAYCLTEIINIGKNRYIIHRWIHGKNHYDVKLYIKNYPHFITWSYKTFFKNQSGKWIVEVLNENGKVLATRTLEVEK